MFIDVYVETATVMLIIYSIICMHHHQYYVPVHAAAQ
jgi:hypothetical protein